MPDGHRYSALGDATEMKLCFAPMEGITGYVFRNAYAACYGGVDAFYTPFLSNPVLNQIELHDILPENNRGIRLIPQILANRPENFRSIAQTLKDYGYPEVNLNLGCPSGTVVAKQRGSGALREPKELERLLDGIFSTSPLPVSVKCRIGISSENEWEDILDVLLRFPMKELIVHPRLQKEFYRGEVHLSAFRTVYERLCGEESFPDRSTRIPLIYNGDICTPEDYRKMVTDFPKIDGVMLGRGLLRDPELAEKIRREDAHGKTRYANAGIDPELAEKIRREDGRSRYANAGIDPEPAVRGEDRSCGLREGQGADGAGGMSAVEDGCGNVPVGNRNDRLRHFLELLYDGYRQEMTREGPALMKLKELWSYLQVYIGKDAKAMRPLWKVKTLAEYRDVVNMLLP